MDKDGTPVITDVDQLAVGWLDDVLSRSGALETGGVSAFDSRSLGSENARIAKIALRYRSESSGALPAKLLLKMVSGDGDFGPSEVHYYARDYVDLAAAPIPRCYDARYSAERRSYHVLMDDLSDTHRNNWKIRPSAAYGRAVADALAALHAHRWGRQRLAAVGAALPDVAAVECYLSHIRPGLEPMLMAAKGEIDPIWGNVLREVFDRHPVAMVERTREPDGFCLVHGDVNPGNVLSPVDGAGATYLIDRQPFDWSLTVWLGASDLAYLMVHWWPASLRRRLEFSVLRHYHEALVRRGVGGYRGTGWCVTTGSAPSRASTSPPTGASSRRIASRCAGSGCRS